MKGAIARPSVDAKGPSDDPVDEGLRDGSLGPMLDEQLVVHSQTATSISEKPVLTRMVLLT